MANNSELEDILRLRLAGLLANEQISALFGLDDDDFDPTNDFDPLAEMDDMFGDIDHFVEEVESIGNFGDLISDIDAFEAELQFMSERERCPTFPF